MNSLFLTLLACADYSSNPSTDDPLDFPYEQNGSSGDDTHPSYDDCPGVLEDTRLANGENLCLVFQDVANDVELTDSGKHVGVYAFDYNSDAQTDLYIANSGSDSVLYQNNGDSFASVADAAGLDFSSHTSATFQVNNVAVGTSDIIAATTDGCFLMEKSGNTYSANASAFTETLDSNCTSALWFGSDVILGTDSGIFYYQNAGAGNFTEVTHAKGLYDYDDIVSLASTDIDGNGHDDFVALKEVGTDRAYFSDGSDFTSSDIYTESTADLGPAYQTEFVSLSPGEITALSVTRGRSDNYLYYSNEFFGDHADELGLSSPSDTRATAFGDLMGDGILYAFKANYNQPSELLIRTVKENGEPDYFYNEAPELGMSFTESMTGAVALDFNGDGQDDMVTVGYDGSIHLLENDSY